MHSVFLSSTFLYGSDAMLVFLFLTGCSATLATIARRTHHAITINLTTTHLRHAARFLVLWLAAGLVLFKFIVLQGGPGIAVHHILTGNHGSDQFSTTAEALGGLLCLIGAYRWGRILLRTIHL